MEMNRFRTQLGGFHRADVANYIERTAKAHGEELARLRDELACMSAEKQAAQAQVKELTAKLEAALEGNPVVQELPPEDPKAMELEAYRRAEAAERTANQRIRRQMDRLSELMAAASQEHGAAAGEMQQLMETLAADMTRLQELFGKLDDTFGKTEASMAELKQELSE